MSDNSAKHGSHHRRTETAPEVMLSEVEMMAAATADGSAAALLAVFRELPEEAAELAKAKVPGSSKRSV